MPSIQEQIKEIEDEYARTQKNKATEGHLGRLKAKLAKLRRQLDEPDSKTSSSHEGFEVARYGNGVSFHRLSNHMPSPSTNTLIARNASLDGKSNESS